MNKEVLNQIRNNAKFQMLHSSKMVEDEMKRRRSTTSTSIMNLSSNTKLNRRLSVKPVFEKLITKQDHAATDVDIHRFRNLSKE